MADKNVVQRVGYAVAVPNDTKAVRAPSGYVWNNSTEMQNSSKTLYKDHGGGASSRLTETHKAGGFVDGRNGNPAYREESNFKHSYKVDDKIQGVTKEYETQVRFKETTTYTNPSKCYGSTGSYGGSGAIVPTVAEDDYDDSEDDYDDSGDDYDDSDDDDDYY